MVPSASRRELPTTQDSAASVGPGLYIDSLHITRTQEVVLGSAVTPIKGARLRSIRMLHRPCLALPRLALPRLGTSITIAIRETEPSAVTSSSALRPLSEPDNYQSSLYSPSPRIDIRLRPYFFFRFFFHPSSSFSFDGPKFVALMALVERHLRSHFSTMPYKYTRRPPLRVRTPLITRSSSSDAPLLLPLLPPSPSSPTAAAAQLGMATAASANAPGNNHRSIAQKRPRAQTLVLAMPTRPPPPSAPTTPHPSHPHYSSSSSSSSHPQPYHPSTSTSSTTAVPSASSPHVSEILPRLYISDLQTAEDPSALAALGITHVLSAMPGRVALSPALAAHALQVPLHDAPFAELAAHLPRTTRYIARAMRAGPEARVLVHCAMGASRSVAVVCGYLVAVHGLHPAQALEFVRARRAAAAPNRGFVDQLHEYHRSLVQGQQGTVE